MKWILISGLLMQQEIEWNIKGQTDFSLVHRNKRPSGATLTFTAETVDFIKKEYDLRTVYSDHSGKYLAHMFGFNAGDPTLCVQKIGSG